MTRVLAVSGSLRSTSYNARLLHNAIDLFDGDVEVVGLDGLKDVPAYDEDDDGIDAPEAVRRLRAAFAGADAVLIATPEYNSSIPGHLKNALDWVSRPLGTNPLRNKPVAVIGASTGAFGAVWAQAELRKVLAAIGARVVDVELALGHAATRFDPAGTLVDEDLREQLGEVTDALVAAAAEREELARAAA
jgi:chromate reductase, NAD(P)H dehydrogenase (quinone)